VTDLLPLVVGQVWNHKDGTCSRIVAIDSHLDSADARQVQFQELCALTWRVKLKECWYSERIFRAQHTGLASAPVATEFADLKTQAEPGRKDDGGKPRWALLMPWDALEEVMKVLEYGAKKYSPNNWRHVPEGRRRYTEGLMRHAIAYARGQKTDPESGHSHLAHLICGALYLLTWDLEGK
jgi:hypothetical protein